MPGAQPPVLQLEAPGPRAWPIGAPEAGRFGRPGAVTPLPQEIKALDLQRPGSTLLLEILGKKEYYCALFFSLYPSDFWGRGLGPGGP